MPSRFILSSLVAILLALGSGLAQATPSLLVDADTGEVLHAEDAGLPWYPASVTKLMTAYVVFTQIRAGRVAFDTEVVLSPNAVKQIPVKSDLPAGSAMSLEDALYVILAGSANDVAIAIGETIGGSTARFAALMNETAAQLGLTATHFENPNGVFDREQRSSARDLAVLTRAILRDFPEHMHFFRVGRVEIGSKTLDSYNDLLLRYPGAVGMKTGFLCASGRNIVGLVERGGRRLIVVVLGATTERERGERAANLLTRAYGGELASTGIAVEALQNSPDRKPVDMRRRLCTDAAAAYEREQERRYPWGLPGQPSFLGELIPPQSRSVTVWRSAAVPANVPVPTPRPAYP